MPIRIIADSCCDTTPDIRRKTAVLLAPLCVEIVGGQTYVDDGTVDIPALLEGMRTAPGGVRSACPSPDAYAQLMREAGDCFVITISSRLSGSYNAACVGRSMVLEERPEQKIHVFDSQSASAGQTQLLLFLHEQIEAGYGFEQIIHLASAYIKRLSTMFVLEDLGNLLRGGRLKKAAGIVASKIRLCPIMSDDGNGNIKLVAPSLGMKHALRKLVDIVADRTTRMAEASVRLVVCACNSVQRAEKLKDNFLKKCPAIKEIILVTTGAVSTLYANDGGVVIAF